MTEHAPDKVWSGIDIPKTIAGALAAVCAAVVGSFLGVAGTLVGAAVASIIGSVGTEIYARSLKKGREKLATVAPTFIRAPAAVGTPEVAAATEEDSPSHTVPPKRQIRWGRVAMIAGAVFVLAMGTLTVAELITGKSIASSVGHSTKATTTFGGLFKSGSSNRSTPAPAPSATPSPTDTATTGNPRVAPTTEAPTDAQPTTAPTPEPTTAPTTGTPEQDPTGGSGDSGRTGGQGGQGTGQNDVQNP
jgi:hypothetical protein